MPLKLFLVTWRPNQHDHFLDFWLLSSRPIAMSHLPLTSTNSTKPWDPCVESHFQSTSPHSSMNCPTTFLKVTTLVSVVEGQASWRLLGYWNSVLFSGFLLLKHWSTLATWQGSRGFHCVYWWLQSFKHTSRYIRLWLCEKLLLKTTIKLLQWKCSSLYLCDITALHNENMR